MRGHDAESHDLGHEEATRLKIIEWTEPCIQAVRRDALKGSRLTLLQRRLDVHAARIDLNGKALAEGHKTHKNGGTNPSPPSRRARMYAHVTHPQRVPKSAGTCQRRWR